MSQFNPKKLNIEAIHAGQRYPDTRSAFLPSDVNEIIESLYGISLGVENSAKRAFILSTPGNLIDISAVNKNIYFPEGTTIYADGYSYNFVEDKYVAFSEVVKLLKRGIVVYNKKTKTISIETDGFNSGSTYEVLYLFSFAYDSENNLVTDLPVEHLVNGEKQSSDRTIVKEPYSTSLAYINIDTKSYEISIPEGTGFGDIAFNWDETYSYAENVYNEPGLYEIVIVYDRTEELIKSMSLYELYEHRNYAWLFTIRMDGDKFVYCDLEAPFYVDGVLFDDGSSVEVVQTTGESETAVMSQKASTESFVQKVTSTSTYDRAYFVNTKGAQQVINIGVGYPHANTLVARQNGGQIQTGTPTEDRHAVPLGFADGRYVQSATGTTEYPRLYEYSQNGYNQMRYLCSTWRDDESIFSEGVWQYSAVQRDAKGCVQVASPIKGIDAANRNYVDAVYRHDITLIGGFDYIGTTGYMACTVYSRSNTAWDYSGFDCNLTGRTTATGIINVDGTAYTIVGLEKGEGSISYYIFYVKPEGTVEKFNFYDGEGTFTDTVTQMI